MKPVELRLQTLDKHIKQAEIYFQYKDVYKQYRQEKNPKKKEAFAENHRMEITLYEAAKRYLESVLNGHTYLPIKKWKAEHATVTIEQKRLNSEYVALKDEVREVEQIRRGVYDIMREEMKIAQPIKSRDAELYSNLYINLTLQVKL